MNKQLLISTLLLALGLNSPALADTPTAPKSVQGKAWVAVSYYGKTGYGDDDWRGTKVLFSNYYSNMTFPNANHASNSKISDDSYFKEKKYITGKELLSYFKDNDCKEFPLLLDDLKENIAPAIKSNQKYLVLIDKANTAYYFINKNMMLHFPHTEEAPCNVYRPMMRFVR